MRLLVVHSGNKVVSSAQYTFINEQVAALRQLGVEVYLYPVVGKGARGYLSNLKTIYSQIRSNSIDLVHAHYGMCGLLCCLQRMVPTVVTYHGSDINVKSQRRFSQLAVWLSSYNIFVSGRLTSLVSGKRRFSVIPCGIDLSEEQLFSREEARRIMHLDPDKKYILFAGAFDNVVKDYPLASRSISLMTHHQLAETLELRGFSRREVNLLLCAVDVLLMTSITEGSPQVIKEAMACGCPIVSTDVGDVRERTVGIDGCYVADTRDPNEIATLLDKAVAYDKRTQGRQRIVEAGLSNELIAEKLLNIYKTVLHE